MSKHNIRSYISYLHGSLLGGYGRPGRRCHLLQPGQHLMRGLIQDGRGHGLGQVIGMDVAETLLRGQHLPAMPLLRRLKANILRWRLYPYSDRLLATISVLIARLPMT